MRAVRLVLVIVAVFFVWLYVYNSGYGYDAVEYLVIGRSFLDGYPFYAIVPSKSWALYAVMAAFFRLPLAETHAGVSSLVTFVLLLVSASVYPVMRRRFSARAAVYAAALVAVGACFMELNYLEPEGFVFLFGLASFALVTNEREDRAVSRWLVAGLCTGLGMAFKAVAGLYGAAIVLWLVSHDGLRRPQRVLRLGSAYVAGVLCALAVPAFYFWSTGRLRPYVEWSFVFPLLHYPASTTWLSKLYTKLLWVWCVASVGVLVWFDPRVRAENRWTPALTLMLAMGALGLVALLKTQASHYAFPGAAFLLMFAGASFDAWAATRVSGGASRVGVGLGLAVLCVMSGLLYRPQALQRLWRLRSFEEDARLGSEIQALVPPNARAIFLSDSTDRYWVSHRYPSWPVPNTDVQTTYLLANDPERILQGLNDPNLALVEFDPGAPNFNDVALAGSAAGRRLVETVTCVLGRDFTRRDDVIPGLVLWLRARIGGPMSVRVCPSADAAMGRY